MLILAYVAVFVVFVAIVACILSLLFIVSVFGAWILVPIGFLVLIPATHWALNVIEKS